MRSKMAALSLVATASTLKRVGVLLSKGPSSLSDSLRIVTTKQNYISELLHGPSGLSDSLRIVTTKQNYISELLHGHPSISDSGIFIKSGTIDKAVLDSILGAAIGLGVAAVGIPVAVGVAGFTGTGIVAGSIGAKMMSAAAIANGGGVAAGGLVATLQSIGAAGVPTAVSAATTATGAVLGALKDIYG